MPRGMQRLKEGDESGGFCRTEIFSIRGHVAATLNHLTDQLILGQAHCDGVKGGAAFSTLIVERVAVVALLQLEDQRTLAFERSSLLQKL